MNKIFNVNRSTSRISLFALSISLAAGIFSASAMADVAVTLTTNTVDHKHYVNGNHRGAGSVVSLERGDLIISFTTSTAGPVDLSLSGYDISFNTEVKIQGPDLTAYLKKGGFRKHTPTQTISFGELPAGLHQYTISNRNPNRVWGVSDLLISAPHDDGAQIENLLVELGCGSGQMIQSTETSEWTCVDAVCPAEFVSFWVSQKLRNVLTGGSEGFLVVPDYNDISGDQHRCGFNSEVSVTTPNGRELQNRTGISVVRSATNDPQETGIGTTIDTVDLSIGQVVRNYSYNQQVGSALTPAMVQACAVLIGCDENPFAEPQ